MHFDGGSGSNSSKRELLASCYQSCLNIVLEHNKKQRELQAHLTTIDDVTKNMNNVGIEEVNDAKLRTETEAGDNAESHCNGEVRPVSYQHSEPLIESIAFPCISTGSYGE